MVFTTEMLFKSVVSCDERIASIQKKLDSWRVYGKVLNLVDLEMETKYQEKIQTYENNIKLVQVEKLLYNALAKDNRAIFPKLLSKYDELMGVSFDLSENMVITGLNLEGDHLDYCHQSLAQREYIKKLCLYGERR
jgi:hypothetical protein